jgi:hypothetical protein
VVNKMGYELELDDIIENHYGKVDSKKYVKEEEVNECDIPDWYRRYFMR